MIRITESVVTWYCVLHCCLPYDFWGIKWGKKILDERNSGEIRKDRGRKRERGREREREWGGEVEK